MEQLAALLRRRMLFVMLAFAWLFAQGARPALAASTEGEAGAVKAFIPLMFALGIILLASRAGGAVARRLGQPRVLGQLLVGVLLGPTVLDMLHWGILQGVDLQHTLKELAELGVLLLMFNIGLEVHLSELAKVGRVAVLGGALGVAVPIALTVLVALAAGYDMFPALFAGVTLAATSVSISAQVLLELGYLHTKEGNALLATALIDDVLAILAVSLTLVLASAGANGDGADLSQLLVIVLQMAGYLAVAFALAWYGLPRAFRWIRSRPQLAQAYGIPMFALASALFFGWSAEYFGGVAAITGAFIAGVGLSHLQGQGTKQEIEQAMTHLAYVFLVPIFFIDVGLETDLSAFPLAALPFMLALLLVAVISKVFGAGIGARMGGFDLWESLRVGVCMVSRGEVGLIIISIGLSSGLLDSGSELYASLFMVILLTTVLTPPLVRWVFQGKKRDASANPTLASAATGDLQK
ncbi:MAG: cation:proton antiporter [Chloroflexi bacterium]|nr:cation:proton antiporter [Chloroflexota bacterium]MCY4247648.1 cation:proton antiporter [Chloroflexota bacterium]